MDLIHRYRDTGTQVDTIQKYRDTGIHGFNTQIQR